MGQLFKENGTIWISGTYHNIFSIANILTELGFKILNVVTWAKTNPPPNISCRYFTHSTEFIIWARKSAKITQVTIPFVTIDLPYTLTFIQK